MGVERSTPPTPRTPATPLPSSAAPVGHLPPPPPTGAPVAIGAEQQPAADQERGEGRDDGNDAVAPDVAGGRPDRLRQRAVLGGRTQVAGRKRGGRMVEGSGRFGV